MHDRHCLPAPVRQTLRGAVRSTVVAAIATCWSTVPAQASNYLLNGNFATGSIAGWTTGGSYSGYPVGVVTTDGRSAVDVFGETIPKDYLTAGSPDQASLSGAYFVNDIASGQFLSQQIAVPSGNYVLTFDLYRPTDPPGGFTTTLLAEIDSTVLGSYSSASGVDQWNNYMVPFTVGLGNHQVQFVFFASGGYGHDLVLGRAAVVRDTSQPIPVDVPEPAALWLFSGAVAAAVFRRRRSRSDATR